MQNVLEVKGLTKKYGDQYALKDVSLSIKKGEIYGLIGKNGAGKTTLIKIITQVIYPSGGTVSVLGSQSQQEWTKALSHTGSVIEIPVAHAHMSAYENLRYYCTDRGIPNADKVIKETLQYVGLTDTGKKKFRNFSLGMRQRLGIAIAILGRPDLRDTGKKKFKTFSLGMKQRLGLALALMNHPDFLILDEPINGLDPVGIQEFREMVKRLNQELGITIIISSHILSELYLVATRFGFINQGRFIKELPKEEFDRESGDYIILKTDNIKQAAHLVQDKLGYQIKPTNKEDELHISGQVHEIRKIAKELVLADIPIGEIYYAHKDLEKYFTDLINQEGGNTHV